jgi:hypothetical protein
MERSMPEPDFKHVGTVEILRMRIYNIDPYARDEPTATEAVVEPGVYPLLSNGFSHVWVMTGKLNGQFLRRGDGLFLAVKGANAIPLNIDVTFPSKLFGPDDWKEMLADPFCEEGHPEQRLRITIKENS